MRPSISSPSIAPADAGLRVARRRRALGSILVVALAVFVVAIGAFSIGIRLNLSGSIPPGLYRTTAGVPERGTTVLACLPSSIARFARTRGYVPTGSCEDGSAPVGKVVAATAGDTVEVSTHGVSVNGRILRNSAPLRYDSKGRGLPLLAVAPRVVPPAEIWLVSPYSPQSFDSRYFGPIPTSRVVSRIEPLWVAR